jgi:OOP family OmpA-OmpF porin
MHAQPKSWLFVAGLLATAVASGCAPRVFGDDSGIAILGTPPPPVEAPAPEPEPQKRVEVREDRIVINEKIQFAVDSAKILEASHDLLNEVATVIKAHPEIKAIHIEGHASAEGSDAHNLTLSKKRAGAVMKYLTKQGGIAKGMLTAEGYGETRPIADNETEEGREKNRRVEFMITDQDVKKTQVEIDDKGNEKPVTPPPPAGG